LTFEKVFAETPLVADLREALATLQEAYEHPVDIEFAANFFGGDRLKVNILQCRPLQVKGGGAIVDPPADLADEDVIVRATGAVVGQSRRCGIDRAIYVAPEVYGELPVGDRHTVARVIGRLTHLKEQEPPRDVLLMGPGRWGTSSPSLGVPVRFSDISGAAILCEIVAMRDDLVPDVSLGTHFFSELVEMDILYFAVFPGRRQNRLNLAPLDAMPNRLADLMPDYSQWSHAIRVVDAADMPADRALRINANALTQKVVCYLGPEEK